MRAVRRGAQARVRGGDLTEYAIPHNLTRPSRLVYFAALAIADDDGEVVGGQASLRKATGYESRSAVCDALTELEGYRLMKRVDHTSAQRVFVVALVRNGEHIERECPECATRPITTNRGAKRCAKCLQIDRRWPWQSELLNTWCAQYERWRGGDYGHFCYTLAYRVHVATRQPMWTKSEAGEQGSGSGKGEGLCPFGIRVGIFPESIRKYERAGGGIDGV